MILEVKNICRSYPQPGEAGFLDVLKNTSFNIEKGNTTAITGPSGSGKTTLLYLIAGLDSPDSGTITINDHIINTMKEDKLTRFRAKNIGMIFQQFHLMPNLTAEENISLPLEILKSDRIKEKTDAVLENVELEERKNYLPGRLSGGECQRVVIARALVVEPSILFADEPTGNLDIKTGENVADFLFRLVTSSNMTLIVVTHNMKFARRCRRILKLKKGVLV